MVARLKLKGIDGSLVVVANIQMRTLKAEEEKGSM